MAAEDVTVKAQWTEKLPGNSSSLEGDSSSRSTKSSEFGATSKSECFTKFVEVVFGKKEIKEEEIKEIIKEYVDDKEFIIVEFCTDEKTGGTRVIIKFVDRDSRGLLFQGHRVEWHKQADCQTRVYLRVRV